MSDGETRRHSLAEVERIRGVDHDLAVELPDPGQANRVGGRGAERGQNEDVSELRCLRECARRYPGASRFRPCLQFPGIAGADLHLVTQAREPGGENAPDVAGAEDSNPNVLHDGGVYPEPQ